MTFDRNAPNNATFLTDAAQHFTTALTNYDKNTTLTTTKAIEKTNKEIDALDATIEHIANLEKALSIIADAHATYKADTTTTKESLLNATTVISPIPEKDEEKRDIISSTVVDGETRAPKGAINVIGSGIDATTGKCTSEFHSAQQSAQQSLKSTYLSKLDEAVELLNSITEAQHNGGDYSKLTTHTMGTRLKTAVTGPEEAAWKRAKKQKSTTSTPQTSTQPPATSLSSTSAPSTPTYTPPVTSNSSSSSGSSGSHSSSGGSSSPNDIGARLLRNGNFTDSQGSGERRERGDSRRNNRRRSSRRGDTNGDTALPAEGTFTSGYGPRWGTMHKGIDIAAPIGTPIYAVQDGTVIDSGPASGFGNWIRIQHDDGSISVYGHMPSDMLYVQPGDRVQAGDEIAGMGSEGQSTGSHLHFEIWPDGQNAEDPEPWLAERGITL